MPQLGILAYGSLICDPGDELLGIIETRRETVTPFNVEYARSSSSRDGAPTPTVVENCGAPVRAVLFVLTASGDLEEATDVLYRREMHEPAGSTRQYNRSKSGAVRIEELQDFLTIDTVLFTNTKVTHPNPSAAKLADLAIQSATMPAGKRREDGISYLKSMKNCGVITALTEAYENAILQRLGANDLEEAWISARRNPR